MSAAYVRIVGGDKRLKSAMALMAALFALMMTLVMALMTIGLSPAAAHELRPSIVDMTVEDGRLSVAIETNLEAWIADIGEEHDNTQDAPEADTYDRLRALAPAELEAQFQPELAAYLEAVSITTDGTPVELEFVGLDVPVAPDQALARDSIVRLVSAGQVDENGQTVVRFVDRFPETIIRLNGSDGTTLYSEFLRADMASAPFTLAAPEPQSWLSVFVNYIGVGFEHIVPLGLDHIIFVIGLYLFAARLGPLLWQVTAFTLAHTITLALGATGVISLTPWIVESIIAASIVYVGLENIFLNQWARHRIALVFAFGLLHGLGFAGVLGEFGLPEGQFVPALIGFNIGVEFGQLTVIAACFALTFWARNQRWYRSVIVIPVSAVIALIGAYWVLERTGILPESMGGLI